MTATLAAETTSIESTERAKTSTVLTPNFYKTDYAAIDKIDVEPIRAEWNALMAEFEEDKNGDHFDRDEGFGQAVTELPPALKEEFVEFLISSCTSEFCRRSSASRWKPQARARRIRAGKRSPTIQSPPWLSSEALTVSRSAMKSSGAA